MAFMETTPTVVGGVPPEEGANPYIYPAQDAIRTYPSPCAPRDVCKIDVYVGNSGTEDADVYVNLYYAKWGINFGNWKPIDGMRNLTVASDTQIPNVTRNCASSFYPHVYGNHSCEQYVYDLIEGRCDADLSDSDRDRDGAQGMYQGAGYAHDYMYDHDAYFRNQGYGNGYGMGGNAPRGSDGYEHVQCDDMNASRTRFFHVFEDKAHVCLKAVATPAEGSSDTNTSVMHVCMSVCVSKWVCMCMCVCVPQSFRHT
jgi:hypothetical protein